MEVCAMALFGYMSPLLFWVQGVAFLPICMPHVGRDLSLWDWHSWAYLKAPS